MGRLFRTLTAACLVMLAVAATARAAQPRVAVGNAAVIPHGASVSGAVAPQHSLLLTLSLRSPRALELHRLAGEVSDPKSSHYGQTLSVRQFAARFGAGRATLNRVRSALRRDGLHVTKTYANHLSINVTGSVATVERVFATHIAHVRTADGRATTANTVAPTLPADLANDVLGVAGLNGLAEPQPDLQRPHAVRGAHPAARPHVATGGPQPCAAATAAGAQQTAGKSGFGYTADLLASDYGLQPFYAAGNYGQGQTVVLYELGEYLSQSDLAAFQACYGTNTPVTVTQIQPPMGPDDTKEDGEVMLDVDQIIGLAPQAHVVVYEASADSTSTDSNLLELNTIASQDQGKIVSISYGQCENLEGNSYIQQEAQVFEQMALQGMSVFASSGDTGSEECVSGGSPDFGTVSPADPASQPYVTGVGAVGLFSGTSAAPTPWSGSGAVNTAIWNESNTTTANYSSTGGGRSQAWAMPSWQANAAAGLGVVNAFSPGGGCGASMCRESPDVSADGDPGTGSVVYANAYNTDGWQVIGGTSQASPDWAAMAALADNLPNCRGLSLGNINASLYSLASVNYGGYFTPAATPAAFTSLTDNNIAIPGSPTPGNFGIYPQTAAYDLSNGLGVPHFNVLAGGLCSLRAPVYSVTVGANQSTTITLGRKATVQIPASDSGAAPLTFAATGLPPGMTLNPANGQVTGAPTTAGTYALAVSATDPYTNAGSGAFTITVVAPPVAKARIRHISLKGVASGHPKLRFVASAPKGRRLRSVTIHLGHSGLYLRHHGTGIFVHNAKGKTIGGRAKFRKDGITLKFRKAQRGVVVVLGKGTLKAKHRLVRAAKRRTLRVKLALSATDTKHHTTHLRANVRIKKAKARHHRHHRHHGGKHHRHKGKHHHHHHRHHRH